MNDKSALRIAVIGDGNSALVDVARASGAQVRVFGELPDATAAAKAHEVDALYLPAERVEELGKVGAFISHSTNGHSGPASNGSNAIGATSNHNSEEIRPFHEAKQDVIERFEREYAQMVLRRHSGNISAAARAAGIDRKSLVRLLARHGLAVADLLGAGEYGEGT